MNPLSATRKSLSVSFLTLLFAIVGLLSARAATVDLVPQGAVWKYTTGSDLGTSWREPAFDDSSWASGRAELGYGDGGEAALIPASPIRPTYYFRSSFNFVGDPSSVSSLNLEVLRDDGCVVYLNGQEVARYHMPDGTITYNTWALTANDFPWDPPVSIPNLLVAGLNVIAVEVHQANSSSTDVSFDLKLTSVTEISVVLNSPQADQPNVSLPVTLSATATDPAGAALNVSFLGRIAPPAIPEFSIAVLPDTQYYTSVRNGGKPEIFNSQTDWIVANQAALNIVHVAHLGDITDTGDTDTTEVHWINANAAISRLEVALPNLPSGVPYGLAVGNHDQMVLSGDNDPTTLYNKYFGVSRFAGRPYYGGTYDVNGIKNNNHYQLFSASGFDFIVVYLEYSPSSGVLAWANQVLQSNPQRRAIVVSHSLLQVPGVWTTPGQSIYNALKGNPNLFLMLCGHNDGEVGRTDVYNGSVVHTLMADFQFMAEGGSGFMRLLTFAPNNNEIRVTTFSPWLHQTQTDTNSQFSLPWQVTDAAPFTLVQQNTGVASGTETTATWPNLQPGATYQWYVAAANGVDVGTSEVRSFTVTANNRPTVALTASSPVVSPGTPIVLTAVAGDSDGTVVSVEYFDGTMSLGTPTDGSSLTIANPSSGNHVFTAVATDDDGASTTSTAVQVFVGDAPEAPPTDFAVKGVYYTEISLKWTDVPDETEYELSVFGGGAYTLPADSTSATVTGLSPNTSYTLTLTAVNPAGRTDALPVTVSTLALPPPPVAPANLQATPLYGGTIQLSWGDQSSDETAFVVERSLNGVDFTVVQTTGANATGWLDQGLSAGTIYYYRVSAENLGGSSVPTTMVPAAPLIESYATAEVTTLGTVTGALPSTTAADGAYETITEQVSGKKGVRFSALEHTWTFVVTPGKSVVLWVKAHRTSSSDNDNFEFAWSTDQLTFLPVPITLPTTPGDYRSFALPSTLEGTVYLRVRDTDRVSGNTALDSVFVDHLLIVTDATPLAAPPAAPVLNPIVVGDGTASLSWTRVLGAATYSVWRQNGADWQPIAQLADTEYTETGLPNGVACTYYVIAENVFGASEPSNQQSCTPQSILIPEPPTALRATAAKGKINLTWTQSSTPGLTQNQVYRSENGGSFVLRATIAPATAFTDSQVTAGVRYTYYVTALIGAGESAGSNTAIVTAR